VVKLKLTAVKKRIVPELQGIGENVDDRMADLRALSVGAPFQGMGDIPAGDNLAI